MHCWNCAHIVNDDEKKCPSCGASRKIEKGTKIHYCPNCGKGIWGKEKCKYCSLDIISKMHCWNCGHIVNGDEKKCSSCGASRKIKKGTKIHYCPNCGKGIWGKEKCKYCSFDVILKKVVQEAEAVDEKKQLPQHVRP